jgi:hypothetical protein
VTLEPGTSADPVTAPTDTVLAAVAGDLEAARRSTKPIGCIYVSPGQEYAAAAGAAGVSFIEIALAPYPAGAARRLANSTRWYTRTSPLRQAMTVGDG